MTREEIVALQPGRELDALVAEKVMGYRLSDFPRGKCYYVEGMGWHTVDHYSRSISAAWEVVEHFPDGVEVLRCPDGYICFVHTNRENRASGNSAPEAICKAALLATLNNT